MAEPVLKDLTVVVLAAGGGTRMRSKTPKVLHEIGGRSLVGHVLAAVRETSPRSVVAVVGHQRELVAPHVSDLLPDCLLAVQEEQKGTGHAVRVAVEAAGTTSGTVLVAYGDTPLLTGQSLRDFVAEHEAAQRAVSLLSGDVGEPAGYGRVVRDADGAPTDEVVPVAAAQQTIVPPSAGATAGVPRIPRLGAVRR